MSIMSGLGALLGGVSGLAGANTGTQSSTTNTSGTTNNTSSPTFNPAQTAVQGTTAGALQNFITNGPDLTPAMTAGTNAINQSYKGIGDSLQQSLASRGFGNSGASGTAALQTGIAKGGAVGNLQAQLQAAAQQQQLQALSTATGFGFAAPGQTSSGSTTGNQQMNGTYTQPSSPWASMLSGGIGGLMGGQQMSGGTPSWMTATPWSTGSNAANYANGSIQE